MQRQKHSTLFVLLSALALNVLTPLVSAMTLTLPAVAEAAAFDPSTVGICTPTCTLADSTTTAPTQSSDTSSAADSIEFTGSMPDNPISSDTNQSTAGSVDSDGASSTLDVAADFTSDLGGLIDTQIDSAKLAIDGYDLGQIQAVANAYDVILGDSASGVGSITVADADSEQSNSVLAAAYNVLVKPNVAEAGIASNLYNQFMNLEPTANPTSETNRLWNTHGLLSTLGLSAAPTLDSRVIQALNYTTTPVTYGGSGAYNWLNVTNITKGYQNDLNQFNRNDANVSQDGKTVSPCHYGQCIAVSEVGKLKGTTFTYEVDVPQDQANRTLDPNNIDYSQARIVNKQRVADVPIKVSWQTNASSGNSPDFLGGSMQSIFASVGLSQLSQLLTDGGSTCVATAGNLQSQSSLGITQSIGSGCLAQENPSASANFSSPNVYANAFMSGASLVANALSSSATISNSSTAATSATSGTTTGLPANGIGAGDPTAGTTPQYVMGAALLGNALKNPNVFVLNPQALTQPNQLLTVFGQTIMAKDLTGWTGRNEFARLGVNDAEGVKKAIGLSWLENSISSTLSLGQGQTMTQLNAEYPTAFQRLFGADAVENGLAMPGENSKVDFAKLTAAGSSSSQSLDGLLTDIGSDVLGALDNTSTGLTARDSGYTMTLGESDNDAANNARWNRMIAGNDTNVWKEIGASRIANVAAIDQSQQDALYNTLMGQPQLDSTGNTVVDFASIDSRLGMTKGDFQAIFLNGQGWGVLQRLGLVQYAATLGGQSQALANQTSTSYSASTVTNQLISVVNQGNAVVSTVQSILQTTKNPSVQSVVGTLNALLGSVNQNYLTGVSYRINQDPTVNPADGTIRAIQGSLGLLAASGVIPQNTMSQIVSIDNLLAQIYSPSVSITNFSAWNGGSMGSIGTVMSAANLVSAFVGGQTGSQIMNWTVTAIGLEQLYDVAFGSASNGSLTSSMNTPAAFVSTAMQALSAAGYSTGSFNPYALAINPTKQGLFNFVTNGLTAGTPAAAWANEMNLAFNLLTTSGAKLTPDMMTGLITGTSAKALTMLGSNQMTVGLGLAAAAPFMSVLTGQKTFEQAAKTAMTQTALQTLYGFSSQINVGDPTANAALQIVMAGAMGLASNSLTSSQSLFSNNPPGAVALALGLVPDDVKALQFTDPVAYASRANAIGLDVQANPSKYTAQINANADALHLPSDLANFVNGTESGTDLANHYNPAFGAGVGFTDAQAAGLMSEITRGNTSGAHYQNNMNRASQMMQKLAINPDTGIPYDEAGAQQLAQQISIDNYADRGTGPSMLDPMISQTSGALINLGIADIDSQIQGMTGVPNVLRTFYTSKNPSDAASKVGWAALSKYVNLPPELAQVMGAFGGNPESIARTFSQGRAGAAFGTLAASQLYTLTKDAGISMAAGDFLAAQFGPNVQQMQQINATAKASYDSSIQQVEAYYQANPVYATVGANAPGPAPVDVDATNEKTASARELLLSQKEIADIQVNRLKQRATTSFEYAMMDYGATLAIRNASGNNYISMNGMAKAMLDPSSTTEDQAMFLLRTLSAFTPGELGQYVGDGIAGYQIYQYMQSIDSGIIQEYDSNGNALAANTTSATNGLLQEYNDGKPVATTKLPTAAFAMLDAQFGKLLGTSVPSGFSQGLFSFAKTGDFGGTYGGLISLKDFFSSNGTVFFLGSWLDKETGLPSGTTYQLFQAGKNVLAAQAALALEQQGVALAGTAAGSAIAGVSAGFSMAGDAASASETAHEALHSVSSAQPSAATIQLSAAISAAVILVVNIAFSKQFAQLDQSLGLPSGTVSTLVGAGIALGVGMGFFGLTAIAALGGPIGIALLGAGLLAGFIFAGGKKSPPVTKQFTRTFYSAADVAPGFESQGVNGITTSVTDSNQAVTTLTSVPAQLITQKPALSAYQKAPTPIANQPLAQPKASVVFKVTNADGSKPLTGVVTYPAPTPAGGTVTPGSKPLTAEQVAFLNNDSSSSLSLQQTADTNAGNTTSLTDLQKQRLTVPQVVSINVDSNGIVFLPTIKADTKLDLTFSLSGNTINQTASYDGKTVTPTGGTGSMKVTPTTYVQATATAVTTLDVPAYDGGTVTLIGPTLGALATVKSYVPGANSPTSANATSNATGAETTELILPAGGALATSGTTIADPSGNTTIPTGRTTQIVRTNELATQKFTNPMNPVSMPLATATFEANTSEQLAAQLPAVAQFEISKFIGTLLYMSDLVHGGIQNPGSGQVSESTWETTVRPSRIQSYGVTNRFLGTLVIPRYEAQLNRLYGTATDDSQYRDVNSRDALDGLGAYALAQTIEVTW